MPARRNSRHARGRLPKPKILQKSRNSAAFNAAAVRQFAVLNASMPNRTETTAANATTFARPMQIASAEYAKQTAIATTAGNSKTPPDHASITTSTTAVSTKQNKKSTAPFRKDGTPARATSKRNNAKPTAAKKAFTSTKRRNYASPTQTLAAAMIARNAAKTTPKYAAAAPAPTDASTDSPNATIPKPAKHNAQISIRRSRFAAHAIPLAPPIPPKTNSKLHAKTAFAPLCAAPKDTTSPKTIFANPTTPKTAAHPATIAKSESTDGFRANASKNNASRRRAKPIITSTPTPKHACATQTIAAASRAKHAWV